jgi:hypothetical protein
MTLELDAVTKILERVEELNEQSKAVLIGPPALTYDDYQRGLGYREAIRQIREIIIPEVLDELQKR